MITYSDYLKSLIMPITVKGKSIEFPKVIEEIIRQEEETTRLDIKAYLEDIDNTFKNSLERKSRYYIKYRKPRTFITMAGEITIIRTIYEDKNTRKPYYYLEEKLGIIKRQRYTNDVACSVYESYSDENSMEKVGIEIGNHIHSKFSLKDNRDYAIPRSTIATLIKRVKTIRIKPLTDKKEVEDLYILMDEKYLPDHPKVDNDGNKVRNPSMVKSALIVEGLDKTDKNRHKYINPQYYSSYNTDFASDLLEYLDNHYNLEKISSINVLADGANWIKATANDLKCPNTKLTQYLCKFHFSQGLWRIFKDKSLYSIAINYLYHNDKKDLYELFKTVEKTDSTVKNIEYIKNNYDLIQNTIHLKNMNCAMEQAISHHIVSQFSNVPKVYAKKNLNIYLSMRDNYRNKENLKLLYLEGLDDTSNSNTTIINKEPINLSFFDEQKPLPYYSIELKNGKKPTSFSNPSSLSFI